MVQRKNIRAKARYVAINIRKSDASCPLYIDKTAKRGRVGLTSNLWDAKLWSDKNQADAELMTMGVAKESLTHRATITLTLGD